VHTYRLVRLFSLPAIPIWENRATGLAFHPIFFSKNSRSFDSLWLS
jgi:hypothetical protein